MPHRYASRVYTRASGGIASAANENLVEDRIIQLSADLGGPPSDLNTTDDSSFAAAINEVDGRLDAHERVRMGMGDFFPDDGNNASDLRNGANGIYLASGAASTFNISGTPKFRHGGALTEMRVRVEIISAGPTIDVELWRMDVGGGGATQIGATASLSYLSGSTFQAATVALSHTVDFDSYIYWVKVSLQSAAAGAGRLRSVSFK